MRILAITALVYLICPVQLQPQVMAATISDGTADGMEQWGYVEIRPKANLFWWHYKSPQRVSAPGKPWPTILWLQGGPGQSGVGHGNFEEIGPLDVDLNPRKSTWLQKADLIFVDNPVGVGYSYVEDASALTKTDAQAATDMTKLLMVLIKELPTLHSSPLFLVGESYGGKLAAMIGVSVARAIRAGDLKLTLGGIVLGDSWISPDDHAVRSEISTCYLSNNNDMAYMKFSHFNYCVQLSYPLLLQSNSRLDDNAVGKAITMAVTLKQQMLAGQFLAAYKTWVDLLDLIDAKSGNVNMENFMLDNTVSSVVMNGSSNTISDIMNGVIEQKLKIIAKYLVWHEVSLQVFDALGNDFMKPAIKEVDELLSYGVNVTIYQGQLDVICSTFGAEAWVKRLKWNGLHNFLSLPRKPLHYCHPYYLTDGFVRSYKNLHFYWILGAGHAVPVDKPCPALHMISSIVQSPAS